MRKAFSKSDRIILVDLLILVLFALLLRSGGLIAKRARVDIYVDNALYKSVELPKDGEKHVCIEQENGEMNELLLSSDGFCMFDANCPHQDCLKQGFVNANNYESRALGRYIICLPHKLSAEYVPEE